MRMLGPLEDLQMMEQLPPKPALGQHALDCCLNDALGDPLQAKNTEPSVHCWT